MFLRLLFVAFSGCFLIVCLQSSFSFWFRAQTPDMRKMQHPPSENLFSLGALSRRRRQEDEEIKTKNLDRATHERTRKRNMFLVFPCSNCPYFVFELCFCWKCARSAQSTGRLRRPLRGASRQLNGASSAPLAFRPRRPLKLALAAWSNFL